MPIFKDFQLRENNILIISFEVKKNPFFNVRYPDICMYACKISDLSLSNISRVPNPNIVSL